MIDGETGADDHVDDLTRMAVANACVNKWSLRNLYFDLDARAVHTQESKSLAYFHERSGKTFVAYVNYIFR